MDRVLMLKRSASVSRKAHAEQEDGKKDAFVLIMRKAKEFHLDNLEVEGSFLNSNVENVDDVDGSGEWSCHPLLELHDVSKQSSVVDVPLPTATLEMKESAECGEIQKHELVVQTLDGASSSDDQLSAERFAKLREEILRRYFSHEINPVQALEGDDLIGTSLGPLILSASGPHEEEISDESNTYQLQNNEWQKRGFGPANIFAAANGEHQETDVVEDKSSDRSQDDVCQKRELEPPFVFTSRNECGTEGSKLPFGFTTWSPSGENDKPASAGYRSKLTRQDTPYKLRKASKSRNGGKAAAKLFQRGTSSFCGSSRTMVSQSLKRLLTSESPMSTPEKSKSECSKILRNIRGSQKASEEAGKLAPQDSAAERAHLTAELQMIARGCSISSCRSPAGESWESVKKFLSNLFCCGCILSDRKAAPPIPLEAITKEEEKISSCRFEFETAAMERMFTVERTVSLPAFPNLEKRRQRWNPREQRSLSCGFELEKAMEIRMSLKKHLD